VLLQELVHLVLSNWDTVKGPEDVAGLIGPHRLRDVTGQLQELEPVKWALTEAVAPTPPGVAEANYTFRHSGTAVGLIDLHFHDQELVNFRAQVFLYGVFRGRRAKQTEESISVVCQHMNVAPCSSPYGPPRQGGMLGDLYIDYGPAAPTRQGNPSVSFYATHKDWL
jgi:hypothetical protein